MANPRSPGPAPAFPPASPLHAQLEALARELHDVRARLLALDAAVGHSAPPLRAPPLRLARPAPAPVPSAPQGGDGPLAGSPPPAAAPWWPAPHAADPPLSPGPGTRCAGLGQKGVPIVAISCCGLTADQTAATIEQVVAEQMQTRSFVALYLTDDSRLLHLFRYQGLDVELVPTERDLAACPGALSPDAFLAQRMARIAVTWGVTAWRDLGARPLPWPVRDEPEPQTVPVVIFDRDYRRHNPYQHLLHVAVPGLTFRPGPIDRALEAVLSGRATAFHLNWEESLYRTAPDAAEAEARIDDFLHKVDALRRGGGRMIWTLHNETPHEDRFPAAYRRLADGVARRSDLVIVHSQRAADLAAGVYGVPRSRLCVVPHGGYHDLYPPDLSRDAARTALDLPTDGVVFGFVGAVRPYKNVPLLIEAFRRLPPDAAHLMIAGRQMTPLDIAADDPLRDRLILRDGTIPEDRLAAHVRACDAIVLPFDRILTSGSMVLALSLGVTVIVPDLPSLGEMLEDGVNGLAFAPGDAAALAARLTDFLSLDAEARATLARNAATTARLQDWGWIGRRIARRVHALFQPGPDVQATPARPSVPVRADADERAVARRA